MTRLAVLPPVMVAPNGARLGKTDHPALPVTMAELLDTAAACQAAGAGAIHAHLRDSAGRHLLDAGAYGEFLAEMARKLPGMAVQLSTEAAGRYSPAAQRRAVAGLLPDGVSMALREMQAEPDHAVQRRFYHDMAARGVAVQHILYEPPEGAVLLDLVARGVVPAGRLQLLFVLGRYGALGADAPAAIAPFLAPFRAARAAIDWATCAFGVHETAALAESFRLGGKARVGFENSFHMADGTIAPDNAARVREVAALAGKG